MHKKTYGLWLAISLAMTVLASNPARAAGYCKTLGGEMVGFGEEATRVHAKAALDREIAAWETRANRKAMPKDRKMVCKDYIKFLNEFECKETAVLCR
jgi:hypothetical protein